MQIDLQMVKINIQDKTCLETWISGWLEIGVVGKLTDYTHKRKEIRQEKGNSLIP